MDIGWLLVRVRTTDSPYHRDMGVVFIGSWILHVLTYNITTFF